MLSSIELAKKAYKNKGLWYLITKSIIIFFTQLYCILSYYFFILKSKLSSKQKSFLINGKSFKYFYHYNNTTWKNERTIEVPVIYEKIKSYEGKNILEIGNVISNYIPFQGDIVDKYDQHPNIINEDVVNFKPKHKYDLIISISTLEHVGFDEEIKDPEKIIKSILNLAKYIENDGEFIFTVPLGYNPHLDRFLKEKKLKLTKAVFLRRTSQDNSWIQIQKDKIENCKYNHPYPFANCILIGTIKP